MEDYIIAYQLKLSKKDKAKGLQGNTIFAAIYVMGKLILDFTEWRSFVTKLSGLIEEYEIVDLGEIGFSEIGRRSSFP